MPTRLPSPSPAEPDVTCHLGSAWIAVLILAAALGGAVDSRASCSRAVDRTPIPSPAFARTDDAAETALRDMLSHD